MSVRLKALSSSQKVKNYCINPCVSLEQIAQDLVCMEFQSFEPTNTTYLT